jgi:serine phosphatase RsbU (regulator of sigma subunit)
MLNKKEDLPKLFDDAFILFKPRDIVSGDFYWFSEYHNKIVVTAADCTGHGVPGAFMSMIGNELLNKIIKTFGITSPDLILQELHRGIKNALHQNDTLNRDGMDIALFVVDKKQKIMEFAGAKNPLVYIQNNELVQLKADKNAIGGLERIEGEEAMFSKIEVALDVPTWVYVFSDGYQDQFGGPDDRKFMIRRMKELMLEIHQKPMSEQHNILDHTVEDWMKDTVQIDDILVIGVKIML